MTQTTFKTKLAEAFGTHLFMKDRNKHTINELLYVLEHDSRFDKNDFNISVCTLNRGWISIPCLDTFVTVPVRAIWFKDEELEFEVETFGEEQYNCITIYESEGV